MSLRKNILNLFGTQVVSYLVPLLQFPYLNKTLGTDLLGLYIFSLSLITLGNVITNFGFDISISKRIAEGENSNRYLSLFFSTTFYCKLFLSFASLIIIFISMYFSGYFQGNTTIIISIFLTIFFNSFALNWLFQGLEKLYIYSRIVIITRIALLISVFYFIDNKNDENTLYILQALQAFLCTIISYYWIYKWKIQLLKVSFKKSLAIFMQSSEFFLARLGVSIYSVLGSFFLGILSGSLHQVAIYGIAQQLYKAGVYAISAISTPLTPYMARTKNYKIFFKVTIMSVLFTIIGALIGIFFGEEIILIIFNPSVLDAKPVLDVFMVTIIISIIGIHFGYPALIPLNKVKIANYSVLYAGILQLVLISILYIFNINTTAITIAFTYLLCDLLMSIVRIVTFYGSYTKLKGNGNNIYNI